MFFVRKLLIVPLAHPIREHSTIFRISPPSESELNLLTCRAWCESFFY